jgi:hypothetical protein
VDNVRIVDAQAMLVPREDPEAAWPFLQALIIARLRPYEHWMIYSPSTGAAIACENAGQVPGQEPPAGPRQYFGLFEWAAQGEGQGSYRRVSDPKDCLEEALLQMNIHKIEDAAKAGDWHVDRWTPPGERYRHERTVRIPGPNTVVPRQRKGRTRGPGREGR